MRVIWMKCDNLKDFAYIAGFRVERCENLYTIGTFENALIKFQSEKMLIKFLTI